MEHDNYIGKLRSELKEVALKLINDEIDFVEGIRAIIDRLNAISLDDDDLNLFRGIDSNTDDVPVGETRKSWNKESLRQLDDELFSYIEKVKPQVKLACKKIIRIIDEP